MGNKSSTESEVVFDPKAKWQFEKLSKKYHTFLSGFSDTDLISSDSVVDFIISEGGVFTSVHSVALKSMLLSLGFFKSVSVTTKGNFINNLVGFLPSITPEFELSPEIWSLVVDYKLGRVHAKTDKLILSSNVILGCKTTVQSIITEVVVKLISDSSENFSGLTEAPVQSDSFTSAVLDSDFALALICLMSPPHSSLISNFTQIYSSERQGSSFRSFFFSLLYYTGPVVLIASDDQGRVWGLLLTRPWEPSKAYDTSGAASETALFQLRPVIEVRGSWRGSNYLFFDVDKGLGVGGQLSMPRVYFRADSPSGVCQSVTVLPSDASYEPGQFLSGGSSDEAVVSHVICVEVWALGPDVSRNLAEQSQRKEVEAEAREEGKKVNRTRISEFDRSFLLSKTFAATEQARTDDRRREKNSD
jgi:hypothetical protein